VKLFADQHDNPHRTVAKTDPQALIELHLPCETCGGGFDAMSGCIPCATPTPTPTSSAGNPPSSAFVSMSATSATAVIVRWILTYLRSISAIRLLADAPTLW
jgi:hypothetical protein